jgi:hypothetical protein
MKRSDPHPMPMPSEREQQLAKALRANLRRRKAGEQGTAPKARGSKSVDEG